MAGGKRRADQLLVERGLVESRARAQALILAGKVFSGERRVAKAGDLLAGEAPIEVRGQDHPWVSRGGLKLDHALRHFGLSPAGLICLDVGASTGGFTDVLLYHGAAKVHAVDVGHVHEHDLTDLLDPVRRSQRPAQRDPHPHELDRVEARLVDAGHPAERGEEGLSARDPSGNRLVVRV